MPSIVHIFSGGERTRDDGATILYHNSLVSGAARTPEIRTNSSNNSSSTIKNYVVPLNYYQPENAANNSTGNTSNSSTTAPHPDQFYKHRNNQHISYNTSTARGRTTTLDIQSHHLEEEQDKKVRTDKKLNPKWPAAKPRKRQTPRTRDPADPLCRSMYSRG